MLPGIAYEPLALPDIQDVRSWFPALDTDFVFLENAGGSQVPGCVADAIRDFMLRSYVQLGAPYPIADRATQIVADAHTWMEQWVNAGDAGKVVLGPSTTALVNVVANAYADILTPGDEIIVAVTNHEANAGPWVRLEKRGMVIKFWEIDPETLECPLSALADLLNPRTKIVAFPHVSNLLGEVVDVKAITKLVHQHGARVFVDGVAYAPHGVIDVQDWHVDWYVFSNYKVYGPHMATLYGSFDAFSELTGPNHFFIPSDSLPYKWELGSLNYEGCAGLLALRDYVRFLSGIDSGRDSVMGACSVMTALEKPLVRRLLGYLDQKEGVTLIGPGLKRQAVGTTSFLSDRVPSPDAASHLASRGIGIRYGHMYAKRLCDTLCIDPEQGVIRISLLHYNTVAEIDRTIAALEEIL